MAVPFSNTRLRVPRGFQTLVWIFTREVLRDGPKDVYSYGSAFFQKLLDIRDLEGHDPAVAGAHSEDRFYNNWDYRQASAKYVSEQVEVAESSAGTEVSSYPVSDSEHKETEVDKRKGRGGKAGTAEGDEIDIDLTDPDIEDAAIKIQAQFKGFKARKQLKEEQQ